MKNNFSLLLLLIFCTTTLFGQGITERVVQGRILVASNFVDGVNIKNETTGITTTSRIQGFFRIPANEGDVIIFTAVHLETLSKIVTKFELINKDLKIEMSLKSIVLKDIIINNQSDISAEKLGIIPFGQKKYTPAERKLYTATSGGGIDGILNSLSGRKQMLEKEIKIERKEQFLQKLDYLFEEKYYTEQLKIPSEYIKGFQYFCIENEPFCHSLKAKNKTMSEFLIIKLAEQYNQILANENK